MADRQQVELKVSLATDDVPTVLARLGEVLGAFDVTHTVEVVETAEPSPDAAVPVDAEGVPLEQPATPAEEPPAEEPTPAEEPPVTGP